jgi:mannose-6-phosphate isomerase class I
MNVQNYILDTDTSNVAKITLNARYPEKGQALNTESEMVVYVLEGKVILNKNGEEITLEKEAVVLIKTQEKYFWQPNPEASLLIFSTPLWTSEQQRIV